MAVKIFFCYARGDEALLNQLKGHLRPLQRQGLIDVWYDRDISAGVEWEKEISQRLDEANIILLLVSPDFINSEYCYSIEMKRAIERHERKEAIVIPIILRPIYWQGTPLGKLQALPRDGRPVTSWPDVDEALFTVAAGIGNWSFYVVVNKNGSPLLNPLGGARCGEPCPYFKTGYNQPNVFTIWAIGSQFDVWLNGYLIDSISDTNVTSSFLGVRLNVGSSSSSVEFSDLRVWQR